MHSTAGGDPAAAALVPGPSGAKVYCVEDPSGAPAGFFSREPEARAAALSSAAPGSVKVFELDSMQS